MAAKIIEQRLIYDGWYKLSRLVLRMPDGAEVERHLLDNGSAVMVLPYDPIRRVALLISQPRAPVLVAGEPPVLEAIAGNLDGWDPEARVREEAVEEAGVRLGALEFVANVWSLPTVSLERVHLYLACYDEAARVGPGGGAEGEGENITVHEMPLDRLWAMAETGGLTDAKTLVLVQALRIRYPLLFN